MGGGGFWSKSRKPQKSGGRGVREGIRTGKEIRVRHKGCQAWDCPMKDRMTHAGPCYVKTAPGSVSRMRGWGKDCGDRHAS